MRPADRKSGFSYSRKVILYHLGLPVPYFLKQWKKKKKKREREIFTAERFLEVIHVESSIWIYG